MGRRRGRGAGVQTLGSWGPRTSPLCAIERQGICTEHDPSTNLIRTTTHLRCHICPCYSKVTLASERRCARASNVCISIQKVISASTPLEGLSQLLQVTPDTNVSCFGYTPSAGITHVCNRTTHPSDRPYGTFKSRSSASTEQQP